MMSLLEIFFPCITSLGALSESRTASANDNPWARPSMMLWCVAENPENPGTPMFLPSAWDIVFQAVLGLRWLRPWSLNQSLPFVENTHGPHSGGLALTTFPGCHHLCVLPIGCWVAWASKEKLFKCQSFGGFHSSWWLAGVGRVVAVASGSRSMWVPSSVGDPESAALALQIFTAHIVDLV